MFRDVATIEHREAALDVLRCGTPTEVRRAEAESERRRQRLAAERALDSVLADSFPASDPPSWTLGITRPQPRRRATRTFRETLVSLAGAAGIALLVPFVVLLIGSPIALAVRVVVEAASWLLALILG